MEKELAYREGNGLAVTLYWNSSTDRVSVTVDDVCTGVRFELNARPDEALDLFYHPFAHAARRRPAAEPAAEPVAA